MSASIFPPSSSFEWDPDKDRVNQAKHGVSFADAEGAFLDQRRVLHEDVRHSSSTETRYFCFGMHGGAVLTVRFTYRDGLIRIFGAGYWTKGRHMYEQANQIHQRAHRSHEDH